MAFLSNYLSSSGGAISRPSRRSSPYVTPRPYTPYSPSPKASGSRMQSAPFSAQDFASSLLAQTQARKVTTPSTTFDDPTNYDPILARIQALQSKSVAEATTESENLRRDAVRQTGDVNIAQKLGFDPNTIAAAQANPESAIARLNMEYEQRKRDLAEAMQAQNLYNSGTYVDALAQLGLGKASQENAIGQKLQELLSGADQGLLAAKETARQAELQARQQAAISARYGYQFQASKNTTKGGLGAGMQIAPDSMQKLGSYGYSDEDFSKIIWDQISARGWQGNYDRGFGPEAPQLMRNGELFQADGITPYNGVGPAYAWVKVGTDYGTSTEMFQVGVPPGAAAANQPAAPPPPVGLNPDMGANWNPNDPVLQQILTGSVDNPISNYLGGGTFIT